MLIDRGSDINYEDLVPIPEADSIEELKKLLIEDWEKAVAKNKIKKE